MTYNTYAQLYCRSNIFGIQGNLGSIQLEKPTKIATSLNITNSTLASNYCTSDSTGVNIATGLTFEKNGVEYLATKTTDNWNQGTTNKYYLTSLFNSDLATKTTTDLSEGTNLYYTSSRFNSAFATMNTTYLTEGTNLYYTSTRFGFDFGAKNTDYLTQGTTNKYLNAFSISDTTEINHTYSTLSPILSSEINIGSIILSKLNSSVYSNANSPNTLVQRDSLGNFSTNFLNLNNITASALCTFSGVTMLKVLLTLLFLVQLHVQDK